MKVDLFGMPTLGSLQHGTASGTVVALHPGTITVRLDEHASEVTVGPARLLQAA